MPPKSKVVTPRTVELLPRRRGQIEPVSGGCDLDHSKEAVGQLILLGRLGAVDLELTEHALDAIALLSERPTMFDFPAAV